MEVSSGAKHQETSQLSLAQVAALMRKDVAALVADGTVPDRLTVSVTAGRGSSIDIAVGGLTDAEIWNDPAERRVKDLTPLARKLDDALGAVHWAYNRSRTYKGEDLPDRRFYGGVELLSERDQEWRRTQRAEQQARATRNREEQQEADQHPLRATLMVKQREIVVARKDTGAVVATVAIPRHAFKLEKSYQWYLLEQAGWEPVRYHQRSKSNPTPFYTVKPGPKLAKEIGSAATAPLEAVQAPTEESVSARLEPAAAEAAPAPVAEPPAQLPAATEAAAAEVSAPPPAEAPPAAPQSGEEKVAAAVASLSTRQVVEMLGILARKRTVPSAGEALVGRALLALLEQRRPEAFDAVADLDAGDGAWLRKLVEAASDEPRAPRGTPARDNRELCERDPRCHEIELDGTGLSGTHCPSLVRRRRPLLSGQPQLGETLMTEKCMALALWALPGSMVRPGEGLAQGFCTKHTAAILRAQPLLEVEQLEASAEAAPKPPVEEAPTASEPAPSEQVTATEESADDAWDWDGLTLHHSAEHGTVLFGASRGDGAYEALKAAGQTWRSGRSGVVAGELYVPSSRGQVPKLAFLKRAEEALVAADFKVRREVEGEAYDPRQVREAQRAQAGERVKRFSSRAERASAGSESAYDRADALGERFHGGQPIPENSARAGALRDRDRMHGAMHRGSELRDKAAYCNGRAEGAAQADARKDQPLQIARRIHTAQGALRKTERELATAPAGEASTQYWAQLALNKQQLEANIAADREALDEHVAAGRWRIVSIEEVEPGGAVFSERLELVESVGRTRVKIDAGRGMEVYRGIHEIGDCMSAAEVAEHLAKAAARRAERSGAGSEA